MCPRLLEGRVGIKALLQKLIQGGAGDRGTAWGLGEGPGGQEDQEWGVAGQVGGGCEALQIPGCSAKAETIEVWSTTPLRLEGCFYLSVNF